MAAKKSKYEPTWSSLKRHRTPEWLDDAKYGIYFHWGIYSVPEFGPNGSWYPNRMYIDGTDQQKYHTETFGHPSKFGYKDLIPLFTAEHFDPDAWAETFKKAGAKFAGPVTEHHDGFSMWDSKVNPWNAAKMGPKRNIVGEMERAIRKQGLKFMVAFHHAENWWFYPHWRKEYDTSDPKYAGLYGPAHNTDAPPDLQWHQQDIPSREFMEQWKAKIFEVIDAYRPDLIWFDFGLGLIDDRYKTEVLAYYYNAAEEWGTEVEVFYKMHDIPPAVGVLDYELGRADKLTYNSWVTDSSVDDQGAWSFVKDAGFKSVDALVHNLVDNVSKHGYLLMNFGPRANGEFPEGARNCLLGIGEWLDVNGEAIYGSTPWSIAEEGPTRMEEGGMFSERKEVRYTAEDIRFTVKDLAVYAICLGWPEKEFTVKTIVRSFKTLEKRKDMGNRMAMRESDIESIRMLGVDRDLAWDLTDDGLTITRPDTKPCAGAYVFKIARRIP